MRIMPAATTARTAHAEVVGGIDQRRLGDRGGGGLDEFAALRADAHHHAHRIQIQ
jgi:hypothetical protein